MAVKYYQRLDIGNSKSQRQIIVVVAFRFFFSHAGTHELMKAIVFGS